MSNSWDERYRERPAPDEPASFLTVELAPLLGTAGRAVDLAGGAGRNAIWLASHGWRVTLVDTSEVALALAADRATAAGVDITAMRRDLTAEPVPEGPWDLALIVHYLQRDLIGRVVDRLADGGLLAVSVATVRNLERRAQPPLPYLLEPGEAPTLVDGLELLHYGEGWSLEDRHEARIIARKPATG